MREAHGINVYSAKAQKIPTLALLIQNFASNVLSLDGPLPVATFAKSQILTDEELAELETYLKDIDAEKDDGDVQ